VEQRDLAPAQEVKVLRAAPRVRYRVYPNLTLADAMSLPRLDARFLLHRGRSITILLSTAQSRTWAPRICVAGLAHMRPAGLRCESAGADQTIGACCGCLPIDQPIQSAGAAWRALRQAHLLRPGLHLAGHLQGHLGAHSGRGLLAGHASLHEVPWHCARLCSGCDRDESARRQGAARTQLANVTRHRVAAPCGHSLLETGGVFIKLIGDRLTMHVHGCSMPCT